MLDGVDHQLGQPEHDALRIRAELGEQLRQFVRLVERAEAEFDLRQLLEGLFQAVGAGTGAAQRVAVADRGAHDGAQRLRFVGLGQVVVGAGGETFAHLIGGGGGGLHDHRHVGEAGVALHAPEQRHAVEDRHHAIENDQVVAGARRFERRPGAFAVFRSVERVARFFAEVFLDDRQIERFVVDDKDAGLAHGCPSSPLVFCWLAGTVKTKQAPPPASLQAPMLP